MSNPTVTKTPELVIPATPKYGEFSGTFHKNQEVLFDRATTYLRLSDAKAHKLAENWAADAGRVFASAKQHVTYGALKGKDNKVDIKAAMKVAGVTPTFAISVDMLLDRWLELGKYGLHCLDTQIVFQSHLREYVENL